MSVQDDNWIFAYGSLLWNPGFEIKESAIGRLEGYARSFCLRSVEHRGTCEVPGLVLGLDPDPQAYVTGMALRVADQIWDQTIAEVRARELVTDAYCETLVPVALRDGRHIRAISFVMRKDHPQYAGGLDLDEQAMIISRAHGGRGPNWEYLLNTASHLRDLGVEDVELSDLAHRVRRILGQDQDHAAGF